MTNKARVGRCLPRLFIVLLMTLLVMCSVTTCNGLQKPKLDYTNQYQKQLKNFVKALYVCVCAFADDFKPQQLNYDVKVTCTYIPYFESASGGGGRGGRFTGVGRSKVMFYIQCQELGNQKSENRKQNQ